MRKLKKHPYTVIKRLKYIHQNKTQLKELLVDLGIHDTVGAVALDKNGNVAAGVSTGGAGAMVPGRVGDCPQIGCGMYADNEFGAIATTGTGENIARIVLARQIGFHLEKKKTPKQAGILGITKLHQRTGGDAGALILTPQGQLALVHTDSMIGGYCINGKKIVVGHEFEKLKNI